MSNIALYGRRVSLAAGLLTVVSGSAPAQSLAYVGGAQYATGDFVFTERTWSAYLSNGLAWSAGRLRAAASIPLILQPGGWLQYGGAGTVVPTGGMAGSPGSSGSSRGATGGGMHGTTMTPSSSTPFNRAGVGDPIGRIEWALTADAAHPTVSIVGAAKAPLADVNSGYGTGRWDVGAGLSSAMNVGGVSIFADAVYWKLGNPPGASIRNAVVYAISAGRALALSPWSVLGSLSGASSLSAGVEAPVQAGVGVGYLLESGRSLFVTVGAGLTRTAPALSTGLGWRVPLTTH